MKVVVLSFLIIPALTLAQNGPICILKAHIAGLGNKSLVFWHQALGGKKSYVNEKVKARHDEFTYAVNLNEPTLYRIHYYKKKTRRRKRIYQFTEVFLENGNLEMTGSFDSLSKSIVKGSALNSEWKALKTQSAAIYDSIIKAAKERAKLAGDTARQPKIHLTREDEQAYWSFVGRYISSHPQSYTAAQLLLDQYSYDMRPAESLPLYNALNEEIKKSVPAILFKGKLDVALKTDIGTTAPDIDLENVSGQRVSLSSNRGKFTLLDFWASWCGPCRMENPNLVNAYRRYHERGFEIYSVSLDLNKAAWKAAIMKDSLSWTHVSDLKGWKSPAVQLYGVNAIPSNVLLDKNGKIIAKNLRDADLEKKLKEVLK